MSAEFAEERFGEIREVTDAGVASRLGGGACPDDDAGDGGWGEGKLDRDISEVVAIEDPKTFALGTNRIDTAGDPTEPIAGEIGVPKIVGREGVLGGVFSGQPPFIERHPNDYPGPGLGRDGEDLCRRLLVENIENDLNDVDQAVTHQLDDAVLVLFGGAEPDQVDFPLVLELPQDHQRLGVVVPGAGPGVKLQKVEPFDAELAEPLVDIVAEVGCRVAFFPAAIGGRRPGAIGRRRFGGDDGLVRASVFENLRDHPFAAAVSIAGGGIDQVDASIHGGVERGDRHGVILRAPLAPQRPTAEADFGDRGAMPTEKTSLHQSYPSFVDRFRRTS